MRDNEWKAYTKPDYVRVLDTSPLETRRRSIRRYRSRVLGKVALGLGLVWIVLLVILAGIRS